MKTIVAEVKVKVVLKCDDDVGDEAFNEILNEMDYSFADTTGKATVEDTEILHFEAIESH